MTDPYRELERIATEHGMIPRYLREIVYLSGIGYKQNQISSRTGFSEKTIVKYRRKLREMDQDKATAIFGWVADIQEKMKEP